MSDEVLDRFKLDVDRVGDRAVVAIAGALDANAAVFFSGVLDAVVDAGCRFVVVDVGGATSFDAAALDALVTVSQRLNEDAGVLTLRSPSKEVRRVLDTSRDGEFVVDEVSEVPELQATDEDDDPPRSGDPGEHRLMVWGSNVGSRSSTATVDAALRLVTALAETTVDNADGVSVTLERHGRLMTVAASDDAVKEMDRHQYNTGEGPCLAAKAEGQSFYIESLAEETRWPDFVPLALAQGIHSILSSPLMNEQRPQGALNIYSSTERAFGPRQQELAALFAEQASEILTTAAPDETDEQLKQRRASALAARQVIHQAQGVIMEHDDLTAEAAIGALHRAARGRGQSRRLRDRIGQLRRPAPSPSVTPAMDDTIDPLEQARRTLGMSVNDLWWRYFALGGSATQLEMEAMLFQALIPAGPERDILAVALNERFSELGGDHPIPYSDDER